MTSTLDNEEMNDRTCISVSQPPFEPAHLCRKDGFEWAVHERDSAEAVSARSVLIASAPWLANGHHYRLCAWLDRHYLHSLAQPLASAGIQPSGA